MVLVLMGVSGSGKTTLGTSLSGVTGWPFLDADSVHSDANKRKMAAGLALTDEDRAPWLAALHARIAAYVAAGRSAIVGCSALKEGYRATLRAGLPGDAVQFALLSAASETLRERLQVRTHEYFNPALLGSQLATLEAPADAWHVSVAGSPDESLRELLGHLRARGLQPAEEMGRTS